MSSATVPPADRIIRAVASKSSHPTVSTAPCTGDPAGGGRIKNVEEPGEAVLDPCGLGKVAGLRG